MRLRQKFLYGEITKEINKNVKLINHKNLILHILHHDIQHNYTKIKNYIQDNNVQDELAETITRL